MSIKNLVEMIKHNGLLASMAQLEKLYQVAIENEQKLSEFEARCAALAAENAGLKTAINEHSQCFTVCKCCGTENDCSDDDVCRAVNEVPETDAFLAEVRAQGVGSAINTVIAMMNHQHPVTSKAIDILRAHAYQVRKGVQS